MPDAFNRDELGRFQAVASEAAGTSNGGGAGFSPRAEVPETRSALMKYATSAPSSAPTMTGGMPQIASPDHIHFAAQAGAEAAQSGGAFDSMIDRGKEAVSETMGHGEAGHAGEAAPGMASRFLPHEPPGAASPVSAGPGPSSPPGEMGGAIGEGIGEGLGALL